MKVTIQDTRTSVTVRPRDFKVTVSGARGPQGPPGEAGASEWGDITGDIIDQTDLYNALQAKVPYTGATQDVNLGEYGAQLGNLEFDNTPTNVPTTAGSVYWNDTDGTLNIVLKGGQTISRVGETQHIRALNNTGAQIARGKVVYVVGAQGQRLTIALADADTEILSKDTIGFTAEAIADGAEGFVIVQGVINNISTTGMADGTTVYLSQTAGSYTTTPPADPAHLVILGFIVNGGSAGAGSIYVKVDNGYELEELHNVSNSAKTTPVGDDALLLRDSADNNLWKRLTWTNALAGVKSHIDTFKSVAGGYASLDGSGKVPASELPSYVDDVVEVANYAALPGTGETGKIYVTLDDNKCYRWSGSVYVEISAGGAGITLTTTGTSGAATLVGSTLNIPQYQGVLTNPVTGTGTAGQVAYFNGTSAVTGSSGFVYDGVNQRVGIGNASPSASLSIASSATLVTGIQLNNAGSIGYIYGDGTSLNFRAGGTFGLQINAGSSSLTNTAGGTGAFRIDLQVLTTAPIFSFLGDGDTGIGRNAADTLTMFAGGERARIDPSGNFVIGTTPASARLHVRGSGTTSATTALLVQNSTPSELFKVTDDGNANFGTGMYYDAVNQRVGIGTASPTEKLHVASGNATINGNIYFGNGSHYLATDNSTYAMLSSNRNLQLARSGTAALTVDSSLNIVIGTTTASARLHVRGSGTTSATTALLVQNSGASNIMECLDSRTTYFGSTTGYSGTIEVNLAGHASRLMKIGAFEFTQGAGASYTGQGIRVDGTNRTFIFNISNGNTTDLSAFTFEGGGITAGTGFSSRTTGTINWILTNNAGFAPTSGNAVFNQFTFTGTINQTGGANGITRGLYVNPTLTSAADWRGIESVAASNANHTLLKLRNATVDVFTVKADSKIGFWNATPVAQPTTAIAEAAFVENSGGTAVNVDSTFAGYTIQQIAQALKDIGILA